MLNRRLYLQAWLVAIVALLVAFLTLEPPPEGVEPDGVATFTANDAVKSAGELVALAPQRAAGTPDAAKAAEWVGARFGELPDTNQGARVATQTFTARRNGSEVPLTNVLFTQRAEGEPKSARNILIVAPRDTPPGVAGGASSTAILIEVARTTAKIKYRHPIVFLSVDGSAAGNAGMRWYLNSVERSRIAGVIVLDAPAQGSGTTLSLWSAGAGRQALGLRQLAEQSVKAAGFVPSPIPALRTQLVRLAVPETRGDQRAAIDAGVPAVTLAGRDEGVLGPDGAEPDVQRYDAAGTATLDLINRLDAIERANAPDAALAYAGKILRPAVGRLALLLLALPLLVMALDAAARVRRARVRLSVGLRAVAWRFAPPLVILLLAHLLTRWGVLRGPTLGRPPLPSELTFGTRALLVIALLAMVSFILWMWVRPRVNATGVNPPAEAAGALVWLGAITLVAWWLSPFALVLILPAAHAALAATVAPRRWQVVALAVLAIAAPLAVVFTIASDIDRNPLFAVWYLCETAVSGARGLVGPILAVLVGVCVWSLSTLVAFRARKGLVRRGTGMRLARAPVVATSDPVE
jgi:Peptidase family M28